MATSPMLHLLAQSSSSGGGGDLVFTVIYCAILILVIAGFWKVFTKAGHPGWAAIIPIYNLYILCKIAGRPGWWVILFFIPIVGFIVSLIVCVDIAKSFGQGVIYGVALFFLGFIFYPLLGFGSAQYQGPAAG